jgi:hypothetical protein
MLIDSILTRTLNQWRYRYESIGGQSVQSELNMILPVKSWLEFRQSSAVIHFRKWAIARVREALGTLHFARFLELPDHKHLGYFAVFDGDYRAYNAGPVFDSLIKHFVDSPPVPCESETFINWAAAHSQESIGFYSAYPTLTVKAIRGQTDTRHGGVDREGQFPLTLPLSAKSPTHFAALSQSLIQSLPQLYAALNTIGTVYFLRLVPWGTRAIVLVAEHDSFLGQLAHDLSKHLGPMLDEIFENVVDGPPTPVQGHTRAFTDWVIAHDLKTWGLYSGYPSVSVQDIRVLSREPFGARLSGTE